ncbi:MAG: sensor histidine kinase [Terracoccus sp.]
MSPDLAGDPQRPRHPWERFGWLMRSIWLVFLLYPLSSILGADRPVWQRVVGLGLLAGFVVVYVQGSSWSAHRAPTGPSGRRPALLLLLLAAIAASTALVIGLDALGFVPFVLSFAMFALPVRWAFALAALGCAGVFVVPALLGVLDDWWSLGLVVVSVVVATGIVRLVSDAGADYDRMRSRLAVVAERDRLARDVHDVLGHSLTVVTVKAELAERLVELDPDRARAELADIQRLSRQALAEVRATVGGLRVARLDDELLAAAHALDGAGIEHHLPDDPGVVDPRHRIVLAWVLREAVTNVVRHSRARRCDVELGPARLVVRDDGRGLDSHAAGNGLTGLRERVGAADGTVSIGPGPDGRGTTLEVTL